MKKLTKFVAVWVKCRNCRKKYTQTTIKYLKTQSLCPHCQSVNQK